MKLLALLFAFATLMSVGTRAEEIRVGNGLLCDTEQQVLLFASLMQERGVQGALQAVNEDAKSEAACVVGVTVAYIGLEQRREVKVGESSYFVAKVTVVGVAGANGMRPIQPVEQFTLLLPPQPKGREA